LLRWAAGRRGGLEAEWLDGNHWRSRLSRRLPVDTNL
jgi:hypothetical protein